MMGGMMGVMGLAAFISKKSLQIIYKEKQQLTLQKSILNLFMELI
jgi:hypothetical protein